MIDGKTLGIHAGKAVVDYGANKFCSHVGQKIAGVTGSPVKSLGKKILGSVGEGIGGLVGGHIGRKVVSSLFSEPIKEIGNGIKNSGYEVVDAISGQKGACQVIATKEAEDKQEPKKKAKWIAIAFIVAKVFAAVVGGVAFASGAPWLGFLVVALVTAVPKIYKAFTQPASSKQVDLFDDVFVKTAKKIVFGSIGAFFGNIVRFNFIQNAFDSKVDQAVGIGKVVDSILPEALKGTAEKVAYVAGHLDGARHILDEETLNSADTLGDTAEKIVQGGLDLADHIISKQISSKSSSTLYETSKKAAWIGLGILSAVGLTLAAPTVAPMIIGTSFLSVFDKFVLWARS